MFRIALSILTLSLSSGAFAADTDRDKTPRPPTLVVDVDVPALMADVDKAPPPPRLVRADRRPSALAPLYVSLAGLQVFDAFSTVRGVRAGAFESNDLLRGATDHPTLMYGIKAAAAVAPMVVAERLWRSHHRTGAILTIVLANSMVAVVAANNARVLSNLR